MGLILRISFVSENRNEGYAKQLRSKADRTDEDIPSNSFPRTFPDLSTFIFTRPLRQGLGLQLEIFVKIIGAHHFQGRITILRNSLLP